MTDGQKFGFYLPVWNRCKDAREWYRPTTKRRTSPRPSPQSGEGVPTLGEVLERQEQEFRGWPDPAGPAALQVLTIAKQTAKSRSGSVGTPSPTSHEYCGVTAEDLRRACTFVATADLQSKGVKPQVTASSKHLNNTQVNHLVTLLKLLIEPDDLKAVTDWLHPEHAQRNGLVDFIAKLAPEGLLRTIYLNAYDSGEWRDGNRQQLVWLLKQVKGRTMEFREKVTDDVEVVPTRDLELEPF